MKPNIFDYATSELSQDAFLSWIIKWADKEYCDDKKMNQCGKEIVEKLSHKKIPATKEYTVDVYKQYTISNGQKMDLWITFNEFEKDPKKEKYSLVIEDKVDTSFHDSQLKNYRKEAEDWCKENNVKKSYYCYYKSGFLSEAERKMVETVYSKGNWKAVSVYDILPILKEYTENPIIEDYVNYFSANKIDLNDEKLNKEDLFKLIINSLKQNGFTVDSKRKEGNSIGVYASKNEREYWAGYWKNPDKPNHCFYICCSAKQNEIDKLEKVKSEYYEFDIDKGNQYFPCDFYISEKFYSEFNKAEAEKQEIMLSDLIKEIDERISNI